MKRITCLFTTIIFFLMGSDFGICLYDIRYQIRPVPPRTYTFNQDEQTYARQMSYVITSQFPPSYDPSFSNRVQKIGQRVASVSERGAMPFKFVATENYAFQAISAPGNQIVVFKGLAQPLTDDELAFALGHKDYTMTLRYSHLSPSHKKHAVDVLGRRMVTSWTPKPQSEDIEKMSVLYLLKNKKLQHKRL